MAQRIRGDVATRLWKRVDRSDPGVCWRYQGLARTPNGYAQIRHGNRMVLAHRLAFELTFGPVPAGLQLDHLCRVRDCVNPAHLEPVTNGENRLRGYIAVGKQRKLRPEDRTRCPSGHPYDEDNTVINSRGARVCRVCRREATRRWRARRQ
ncbi:MAG TPA: HNH endonuclease signature motif containing protein [Mycobacteriales bacterium]|nr:HNH endonuclease signature motif containing protein [Mycobacteriales bacterium]